MARNGSGTMTIPNTFVSGNTITASGHNQNNDDIATELTNSVAADGQTVMTGPLKAPAGTAAAPAHTFGSDLDTGAYRSGANEYAIAVAGALGFKLSATELDVYAGATQLLSVTTAGLDIKSGALLINGAAPTSLIVEPQGYLTLTSNLPVLAADVTAATAVYYTFLKGNLIPISDGSVFNLTPFTELTLTLVSNHSAGAIFDCFVISDSGTLRLVTGPAWTTATAGAGARGTGAGTTELQRFKGLWTNKVSMTGRYGSSTTTVAANCGTYVGSIYMDGTNGQVSCHRSYGQSRKWGVWNAYNRIPITLIAGDGTASWTSAPTTWRVSRAQTVNSLITFCGLAEEAISLQFLQMADSLTNNTASNANIGIGLNSATVASGKVGENRSSTLTSTNASLRSDLVASYQLAPTIGPNLINALEQAPSGTTNNTFFGAEIYMRLTANWRA